METEPASAVRRGVLRRIGESALKVLGLFVILEPIWMLLPFAGFLYGSVLHIQTLNQHRETAWLTHFVFPVLTGGWVGLAMIAVGFALFAVAAGQVYWAKIRRSGLVAGGLYRFVRHPQYISLTLFGLGILLVWGRAVTFLALFAMMFLYYYLAKHEEAVCRRLFGQAYEDYRRRTSFIVPGDRLLRPLGEKWPGRKLPAAVRASVALAVTMAICLALMALINRVKLATRTVPYLAVTVNLGPVEPAATRTAIEARESAGIPFVQAGRVAVARGPYRNAATGGFAERVLLRLRQSKTLTGFLAFLDEPGQDVLIVWCGPYAKPAGAATPGMHRGGANGGRGPAPDPHGPDRVRLILMRCTLAPGATVADALADKAKRTIRRGCVAAVNVATPAGEDFVEADGKTRGPGFPGEQRWAFFQKQFADRPKGPDLATAPAAVPGRFATARLVMVQAPILRTRIDPAFAREMLDRLTASETFRRRMRQVGAGGAIVPVAFPRPGPNWYQAYHAKPQVSLFVILARLRDGAPLDDLFRPGHRDLIGAFIVPMDFQIAPPADSVGEATMIGLWRNLEERWQFFLSGLGGSNMHHH